ncbi:MAG TPA: DUF885 domain-containing protein [Legionellaceae bacterium]|nr:DUF885 domain-containing protein [Legionellaceae bacterium]
MNKKKCNIVFLLFVFLTNLALGKEQTIVENKMSRSSFSEIAQQYEASLFEYSPELGLFWGKTDVALDRFTDWSVQGYKDWHRQEDAFLFALRELDEATLRGSAEYTTYLLLKATLEAKQASRICREELWDVNPARGWHNKLAIVAEKQPVGTPEYRAQAMRRWQSFPKVVDIQINNLKLGIQRGYTAPKPAVKRVLTQIHLMLNNPIEQSPYFDFARRDGDPTFKANVADLIKTKINPALKIYSDYLEKEYMAFARAEIGVSALPAGQACYQAKINEETTLSISPEEIHALGLATIEKISWEVADIGLKRYETNNMAMVFQRAEEESVGDFSTEKDIIDYNLQSLDKVMKKLPNYFDMMPKADGILKPYPQHRAITGASGEYHPPNDTGTEPGIFYINTYEPQKKSRIDQEATLFHELIPGHHFQIALAYENTELPTVNRYLFNAGFGEGWALYVERLADEMGLYQDEISRLGMLSNEALRAARLVVDTGIHAFHWNREQAIDYLKQHTALADAIIEGEVDRYIMMPGQATAYTLGKNEIEHLRQEAQKRLGPRFDIRLFHHQVLKHGMVSLPILRMEIKKWIASYDL